MCFKQMDDGVNLAELSLHVRNGTHYSLHLVDPTLLLCKSVCDVLMLLSNIDGKGLEISSKFLHLSADDFLDVGSDYLFDVGLNPTLYLM